MKRSKTTFSAQVLKDLNRFMEHIAPEDLFRLVQDFLTVSRSKTEANYIKEAVPRIELSTGRKVVFAGYEWMSLKLPGGRYTPDWFYLLDNGRAVFVEVKSSVHARGYRSTRAKLRTAAAINPWAIFYEATPVRGVVDSWKLEHIKPDQTFLKNFLDVFKDDES